LTNHFPFVRAMVESPELMGEVLKTDVLVVGGGLAGNNGAIGALEKGARVIIADKSSIDRCGAIAGGVDHFMALWKNWRNWEPT
jgi:succinate dehydrogenase/fumarate reductase flavoprotein subunit